MPTPEYQASKMISQIGKENAIKAAKSCIDKSQKDVEFWEDVLQEINETK